MRISTPQTKGKLLLIDVIVLLLYYKMITFWRVIIFYLVMWEIAFEQELSERKRYEWEHRDQEYTSCYNPESFWSKIKYYSKSYSILEICQGLLHFNFFRLAHVYSCDVCLQEHLFQVWNQSSSSQIGTNRNHDVNCYWYELFWY